MDQSTPKEPALKLKRLQDMKVAGRRVLVRVDFNVPFGKSGEISDDTRIREALPTLRHLIEQKSKIVVISHLGRPKGKPDPRFTLKPVAEHLGNLLDLPVGFCPVSSGPEAEKAARAMKPGDVLLLENIRFDPGEEADSPVLAKALAKLGGVFIQEAFGTLHRAHASTSALPKLLDSGIGFLVQKEIEFLDRTLANPQRPFVAVIGGAKVSSKIGVLKKLLDRVDGLLIGGGMAYTFLQSQGVSVGKSLVEKDMLGEAKAVAEKAYAKSITTLLPADHIAVPELKADAPTEVTQGMAVPQDKIGVDIGPHSIEIFLDEIAKAKTIFWNGPMGIFEIEPFAQGSLAVARAIADATKAGAVTVAGGGDTLAVVAKAGIAGELSHCSTGGGASLELIEGKVLPGLKALSDGRD